VNTAIWELILSAVLLLEMPALVSAAILLSRARKLDPQPTRRQLGIGIGIGLTIPWAGGLIGLVLSVLLGLLTDYTGGPTAVMPVLISTVLSVLALQLWWTRLVLGVWTVDRVEPDGPTATTQADTTEEPESPQESG